jgi:hypothetical protein
VRWPPPDDEDQADRNGEPVEDDLGCLVMLVCLAGIALIVVAILAAELALGLG